MVRNTANAAVYISPAQVFRTHFLAGGCLHQGRTTQEDRARVLYDYCLVRHCGHIRAAGGARTHHHGDLRNAARRHIRLVVENPTEVLSIREDFSLQGQESSTRIDQVDAREVVLQGYLLGTQMLLYCDWVISSALNSGVVCDDQTFLPGDNAYAGDHARC